MSGQASGWVTTSETRCEYVHVRSCANIVLAKVSEVVTHPVAGSGVLRDQTEKAYLGNKPSALAW